MVENNMPDSLVDQYIKEENTSEAVKLLFESILSSVAQKDFKKAEAYYEKLYEVDPMALTEIVRAGEAIEEGKSQSLDMKHREVWNQLYSTLSVNESNALYYEMETRLFNAGDVIISQGEIADALFFINKGEVKAMFSQGNREVLLTSLGPGDFFGSDQFFSATVSTFSVVAHNNAKISCLKNPVVKKWKTNAPALESKLLNYCQKKEKIKRSIEEKGVDRRSCKRIPMVINLAFQFIDVMGKRGAKAYKGEISDISKGGLSFFIKTSKPDAVRMMLGRRIAVSFPARQITGENRIVEKTGWISAVQSQMFDDFSIHVRFENPIEDMLFKTFLPTQ